MVRLLPERSDTKSNVKLGGFRSQLPACYVSSHTEELWYNETVCLWMTIYIYIYIYIYHHHGVPPVQISLILFCHFSLSFIASGRFSGLHPVSSHSYCMYVRAGRPVFAQLYVGVHRSTSLMSSSLLLQQCSACLVRLIWIVFVMVDGRIVGAYGDVASRTYSILLEAVLCNCRLASSPAVLLVSKLCIHTAVSTRPLLGRNCVSYIYIYIYISKENELGMIQFENISEDSCESTWKCWFLTGSRQLKSLLYPNDDQ